MWSPTKEMMEKTNIAHTLKKCHLKNFAELYEWSINYYQDFWQLMLETLHIVFKKQPEKIIDLSSGFERPVWLKGALMNIADSCFSAKPAKIALIFEENNQLKKISYGELNQLSSKVANSLCALGFQPKDAIAIDMPMNYEAVAIYLGIIKMGGVVVSIADSFSPEEIATRLQITKAKAIFTQDVMTRSQKTLPLYEKIIAANAPQAIVLTKNNALSLRDNDIHWERFLVTQDQFNSYAANPMDDMNILFSSGTTGNPKAIPWNHTTPIKAASDAFFHQDIHPEDILAWPTNLGWMMGPWVLFAGLINQATIALYTDAPNTHAFGKFIQDAKVTMLGVVPTLVASWRQTECMKDLDWHHIKLFSSTGESSNPEDMTYLSQLAGGKPIIEYCGGTEIGGAYISSTLVEPNYASVCSTPTLGMHFILLDENQKETDDGEVAIIPPSMGLSTKLLNADHHQIYFDGMPTYRGKILRRHGDHLKRCAAGYSILGRVDDTMNLGAIKTSSVEIERTLTPLENIIEVAAIAVSPHKTNGPSQLVIYAATDKTLPKETIKKEMQQRLNQHLNPLFKIHDVVFVKELPKTASNKIMRRVLRKEYEKHSF